MRRWWYRAAVIGALLLGLAPLAYSQKSEVEPAPVGEYRGKVTALADLAGKAGTKLDADAVPLSLVLAGDDGKVWVLLKDGGSRLFFKDTALLNRPMLLIGRPLPGSQILRVIAVRSLIKGQPHEVYYWCDVCSIKRGEKNICECCGGPMELKEEPLKK